MSHTDWFFFQRIRGARSSVMAVVACVVAMPALADDAQDVFNRAKAFSLDGPDYQFDVEIGVEEGSVSGTVNPLAAPGERLALHSPGEELSDELKAKVAEIEKDADSELWCQSLLDEVDSYTDARRDGDHFVFDLPLSIDAESEEDKKFAKYLNAKVTINADDGAVLQYSLNAPKPFRPVLIAKIKRFDLVIDCERSPDGRTYAHSMRANIAGRAMMKSFEENQLRVVSNLVRLP